LLTTQKKSQLLKKKKTEYCHRPPARPRSITEAAEKKPIFGQLTRQKNIKEYKNLTPHNFID